MKQKKPNLDVRSHIIETAQAIISSKGFNAVGINEILQAAGVPKGSFYHYFKSKEMFGQELLKHYFSNYQGSLELMLTLPDLSGAQRLVNYWESWLEAQLNCDQNGKCLTVKLAAEVCDLSEAMREVLAKETSCVIDRLKKVVEDGIADGSLSATLNSRATATTLYQLWLGATLNVKITRSREPMDSALEATKGLLGLN